MYRSTEYGPVVGTGRWLQRCRESRQAPEMRTKAQPVDEVGIGFDEVEGHRPPCLVWNDARDRSHGAPDVHRSASTMPE